ncbi:MAG: aminotransferase [Armatimonadetes bacterium CG_4_10_14_3_um_filter_66_18]|nr:aminotransferase class I/II-fold pyridoxal phosphate-dependent enzyme [Armatimonadota bacterium]PIU95443.1 MAG: aminotransferase [Armatimonadetes bacterium CG06_land_8_20_14_3_00_66_21]PIX47970.1 MAG: aminotransferase [Armatimonadetes bacterium CG_4_8_14_3_um_filter_66_20]PIY42430.1 MAG: aminotransferase [Armatimonadetes bacterium CG_4_10_14_3_um_filter_66_18]PIZ37353.1 MAG: aminotransferase [Armatimonadetes bacterium CG_4_10_14_0_8_um_filter_66_14]PJB66644.1 MAG: aminotransferase [Armatimo
MPQLATHVQQFTESVIREMTRLARQYDAINLAQGFPDFPCPAEIKEAARRAIADDVNQYAITWGAKSLRDAICEKARWYNGIDADPEANVTVCCGATEAMISSLMAIVNPGDEVVVFEPFYENYGPDAVLSHATPRFVRLAEPDWTFDEAELAAAFNDRTKAIIINTPNNPTGKVFSREELECVAALCRKWDVIAVTDEIYEHILYDGCAHVSIAALDGMADRTITVNAASKTYAVTGWRVGWAVASARITASLRKVHDFLTVGSPHPLQEAIAQALKLPRSYYEQLASDYTVRRDLMHGMLESVGFACYVPKGAYYMMTNTRKLTQEEDVAFARRLVKEIGVAVVPGSSFYRDPADGADKVRFCFAKQRATLAAAAARLERVKG